MSKLSNLWRPIFHKYKAKVIPYDQLERLVFGQQHYGTRDFFTNLHGQCHTIPLSQFPHYLFIDQHRHEPHEKHIYSEYLEASWGTIKKDTNTPEARRKKIDEFLELYDSLKEKKKFFHPIIVCPRPDGKLILVHGNHRASIAKKLGMDIKAVFMSPPKHLRKISLVAEEFYGSARLKMPYQSIFDGDTKLVEGRRPDILERLKMLNREDVVGKTILDLGCNIGNNCIVATQLGAAKAVGVDYSPRLISVAIRLNSYFSLPCDFMVHDLNSRLTGVEPADTVFCFSLAKHLERPLALYESIMDLTKSVLYFEGHAFTDQVDYQALLNKDNFASIDLVGYTRNRIDNKKRNRPLFRCVRRPTATKPSA